MNQPVISVIIPMFREEKNVVPFIEILSSILKQGNEPYEIIIVDDGSTDDTWKEVVSVANKFSGVKGIKLSRNFGKESALRAGLDVARGDALIFMDGDFQHPPEIIPEMISLWQNENAHIIEAIKKKRDNESFINVLRTRLFNFIFGLLTGHELKSASDFKLLDRQVADALCSMPERNLFFRGMSTWVGYKRIQIPFIVAPRKSGRSGWSILELIKLALTAVTAFSSAPLHLITVAGGIFIVFATILGTNTLYQKITGQAVSGFTTVILILLIIGSILMIGLGIIGQYLARIYEEIKQRPRYLIEEIIEYAE